jgi:hypothetical protein
VDEMSGEGQSNRRGSSLKPWPWRTPKPRIIRGVRGHSPRKIFEIWTPEMPFPEFWASNSII